jgi:hypothetical protein
MVTLICNFLKCSFHWPLQNKMLYLSFSSCVLKVPLCIEAKLRHYMPWRYSGERRYSFHSFSTLILVGGEWSASGPGRALAPGKGPPGTHCTVGWMGPRALLDTEVQEKSFRLCRSSNLDCSVVQLVARHYTDWATRLTYFVLGFSIISEFCFHAPPVSFLTLEGEIEHQTLITQDLKL